MLLDCGCLSGSSPAFAALATTWWRFHMANRSLTCRKSSDRLSHWNSGEEMAKTGEPGTLKKANPTPSQAAISRLGGSDAPVAIGSSLEIWINAPLHGPTAAIVHRDRVGNGKVPYANSGSQPLTTKGFLILGIILLASRRLLRGCGRPSHTGRKSFRRHSSKLEIAGFCF